jgi:preprotein translocase subunit SecB
MSETNGAGGGPLPGGDGAAGPDLAHGTLALHKIYVKDVSFESPNAPAVFSEEWRPDVDINVQSTGNRVGERIYEVVLQATITAKNGERTAFLVEVQQAGVFEVAAPPGADVRPVLASECPAMLYPYLREVVSDIVIRGGFPPLLLAPADFRNAYAQSAGQAPAVPPA